MLPLQGNLGLKTFRILELLSPAPFLPGVAGALPMQVALVPEALLSSQVIFETKTRNPLRLP